MNYVPEISPTVLGFDGIPSLGLSLSDYSTLSHSWSGSSTSDTNVQNRIPFTYISLSCASPCLAVHISSVSPHPVGMTRGSVIGARVWCTYHRLVWGHSSEGNDYFLSCVSSKILQQIKPVCLCIVFYIISGQESVLMHYSF